MRFLDVDEQQQLFFNEMNGPTISSEQCLIDIKAIGVNRADLLQRAGKYPAPKGESPILGLEVCGVISDVGSAVANWKVGDKVFGLVAGGAYAEQAKINPDHLMALPSNYSFEQGAALAEVYLTAYQALFAIGNLQPNEHILIHAGASGVGSAAIQLAKAVQATVTVTVSNDAKAQACQSLGADHVINYNVEDFVQWKKQHQPAGFNLILDVVGGDYLNRNLEAAGQDARIVMLAMLGGRFSEPLDVAKMLFKRINIHASTLRNRSDVYKTQLVDGFSARFLPLFNQQSLKPVIETCYSWSDADTAHQLMSENKNIGKYILTID